MSVGIHPSGPTDGKPPVTNDEFVQDQVNSAIRVTNDILTVLVSQLMNNAEEVERWVAKSKMPDVQKEIFMELSETMIKSSFRRQMGRMKILVRTLQEIKNLTKRR